MEPLKLLSEEERGRAKAQSPWLTKLKEQRDRAADARSRLLLQKSMQRMRKLNAGDRAKLKTATPAERDAIFKKAGLTDDELHEIHEMEQRVKQFRRQN